MKKKICLSILCMLVLIGVSGCGSKGNDIVGTYNASYPSANNQTYYGTLKMFDNETCVIETYVEIENGSHINNDKTSCNYSLLGNEVTIKYYNDLIITCTIEKKGLECERIKTIGSIVEKVLWEKQ